MTQTIILGTPNERRIARRLIDQAPFNSVLKISPPGRTTDQNAKMWAMLSDISRAKPDGRRLTPELWKALFMHACGHAVRFEPGLDGEGAFPVGFRSSRLSVKQMADLITFIQEYGDRHGVQWSNEAHHG